MSLWLPVTLGVWPPMRPRQRTACAGYTKFFLAVLTYNTIDIDPVVYCSYLRLSPPAGEATGGSWEREGVVGEWGAAVRSPMQCIGNGISFRTSSPVPHYEHGWGKSWKVPSLSVSTGIGGMRALPCGCAVLVVEAQPMHVPGARVLDGACIYRWDEWTG